MATASRLLILLAVFIFVDLTCCWDTDDFEIFDVVEEVNENFYALLNVDQSATTSEIRKAYRRLSLQLHPDKNPAEDAEVKFRQLVSVYEILKDEDKRQRYDRVLVEGLPDWRQPVFYYRRVRKMGMLELTGLLGVILTVGQYLVAWAVYFEKRLTLEDFYASKKKKVSEKNKKKSKVGVEELEEEIEEELKSLPRPQLFDLWMFRFPGFIVYLVKLIPELVVMVKEYINSKKTVEEEEDEDSETEEEVKKVRKERKKLEIPEYQPELYQKVSSTQYTEDSGQNVEEKEIKPKKEGEWSEEELVLLAKAVNKFPGGTVKRWEKIADYVGRTVEEVTLKSREVKGATYNLNVSSNIQGDSFSGKSKKRDWDISDNIITTVDSTEETTEDSKVRRRNKPTKPVKTINRTVMTTENKLKSVIDSSETTEGAGASQASSDVSKNQNSSSDLSDSTKVKVGDDTWTQNQQVIFEWALKHTPKGIDKRWERIAEQIPGKTKEDCILRFKYLAEIVKRKKEGQKLEEKS